VTSAEVAQVRFGEIPFAPDVEQSLDSSKSKKKASSAAAGEECVVARLDDVGLGAETRPTASLTIFVPDSFDGSRLRRLWPEHTLKVWLAVFAASKIRS